MLAILRFLIISRDIDGQSHTYGTLDELTHWTSFETYNSHILRQRQFQCDEAKLQWQRSF